MADASRTVEIIFNALDQTGSGMSSVAGNLKNVKESFGALDGGIQGIAGPIANFTGNLLKAEAGIATLAAAYGGYAVNEAIKFQTAQNDLNKVLSEGDPPIESFTHSVNDLSDQYGVSSTAILQGISDFKQAGFTATEAAGLQKDALDLVIAGDVDAAKASEILISSIKGFGAEASAAPRYIEALNNVSNDYATDVNQLADGMSRVAPILKVMGFSFEEGTGLLTPMIEVFRNGGEAADALKIGLLKLLDDSKPVTSGLAALGVSQTDLNGNMRSGKDIFYDVAKAFEHLDQNQKLVFASQLFGLEQAPRLVTVFDNLAKVNEVTASAMAKTGSVAKEVEVRMASAEKQLDRFKVGFDNLARVLGGEILHELAGVVGGTTDIENAFRKVVEAGGLDPLFDAIRPQLAEFEAQLRTVAKNLPDAFKGIDFSGLIKSFNDLGNKFKGSFKDILGGVDLTTVEGLHNAIQTTINIISSLVKVTQGIVSEFKPVFAAIGEAGKQVGGASDESSLAAGKLLGAMKLLQDFGTGLGLVLIILKESQADIANVFNTIVGGGRLFTNTLQLAFDVMALAIVGAMEDVVFAIANFLNGVGFSGMAQKFYDSGTELKLTAGGIKENMASNAADVKDAWNQMTDGLAGGSQKAAGSIKEANGEIGKSTNELGSALLSAKDGVETFDSAIVDSNKALKDSGDELDRGKNGLIYFKSELASTTGETIEFRNGSKQVNDQLHVLGLSFDYTAGKFIDIKEAGGKVRDEFGNIVNASGRTDAEVEKLAARFTGLKGTVSDLDNQLHSNNAVFDASGKYLHEFGAESKEVAKAVEDTTKSNIKGSTEWVNVMKVMQDATNSANEFKLKAEELNEKRYEANLSAIVDLKVAEVEAQTARIQAAFDSLNNGITSTGQTLTSLADTFANSGNLDESKQAFLHDLVDAENNRRQQEFDLQKELINNQNDYLKAKINRMNSGQALITIDSGTLAPELDSLFEKVLKHVQIKATEEGQNLLLGLGAD